MKKLILTTLLFILVLQTVSIAYAWEIERPAGDIDIKERRENAYTNGEASVGIGVAIDDYDEGAADYGGDDCVTLNVSMTANSRMELNIAGAGRIYNGFLKATYQIEATLLAYTMIKYFPLIFRSLRLFILLFVSMAAMKARSIKGFTLAPMIS